MAISSVVPHAVSAPVAERTDLNLSVKRVTRGLLFAVGLLLTLHLLSAAASTVWDVPERLRHFFSLNSEANPGAWFSALQLLFCAVLLTVITRSELGRRHPWYWGFLAVGFYYLSLDEGAQVHELLTPLMHSTTGTATGLARQGWVIPGMAVVAIVGLLYLRFLLLLPRRIAIQFAIGGIIFVLGVVGIEILGSFFKESMAAENASCNLKGDCGFSYSLLVALEEGMEMLGITIFANALLRLCLEACPKLSVRFSR
jgi:hypothetical protein